MATVRIAAAVTGNLRDSIAGIQRAISADVTIGVRAATDGAVMDMRQELSRAFPRSRKIATLITGKTTPEGPVASLNAAGRIYGRGGKRSAWPAPLWAQAFGATIMPRTGYLAIPTARVPRDGRNRALTPKEVEARYNEKLAAIPAGRFGKSACLVLNDQGLTRAGRVGKRRAAAKRKPIIMFWLVRQAVLTSRWDPRGIVARWADLAPSMIERARSVRDAAERSATPGLRR